MYKSLSEMKPGQKFICGSIEGPVIIKGPVIIETIFENGYTICEDGFRFKDEDVDWVATNALYAQDTYTAEIHEVMQKQLAKGKVKYGLTLENGTVGIIESIDHAIEEVVDQLYYLTHLKAKLREKYDV
jgi:hypothetical protein